jgi:hypothetical protein
MAIKFAAKDEKAAPGAIAKATAAKAADPKAVAEAPTPAGPATDLFDSESKAPGRKRKTK